MRRLYSQDLGGDCPSTVFTGVWRDHLFIVFTRFEERSIQSFTRELFGEVIQRLYSHNFLTDYPVLVFTRPGKKSLKDCTFKFTGFPVI